MNCAEIDRLLPAYTDGEIDDGEETEIEVHLAHCPACREMVAAQQAYLSLVKVKAAPVAAPEALRIKIQSDVHHARLVSQAQRYGVYAAVAVGVAGLASIGYVAQPDRAIGVEYLTRASREVRNLPLDFDAGSGDVSSWTGRHVSFNPHVPRFQTNRLRGVRQYPVNDQSGLVYVWPNSTLQVFPEKDVRLVVSGNTHHVGDRDVVLASHQGFNVAYWRDGGLVYSLVTDLTEDEVLQLLQNDAR